MIHNHTGDRKSDRIGRMDEESRTDFDLLQGCWSQTRLEADGMVDPLDDQHSGPGALCIIDGSEFRVVARDDIVLLRGSFTLDASTRPKAITWVDAIGEDAGKALPAIYELAGNTFQFVAADEGRPRPTAFATVPGLTMRAFVRVDWATVPSSRASDLARPPRKT